MPSLTATSVSKGLAANIDVGSMYDSESRGARLLDRLRLGNEQQRLVLVASAQSLHFDLIIGRPLQWCTRKSSRAPEIVGIPSNGNHPRGGGHRHGSEGQQSGHSGRDRFNRPRHQGDRGGKGKGHRTYITEEAAITEGDDGGQANLTDIPEEPEGVAEDDLADDQDDDEELVAADDDEAPDFEDLSAAVQAAPECLTVTARRIEGVTLGRKFSGRPKSIEERKKTTHCAACGNKGHWQGDPICPMSKNASGGQGSSSTSRGSTTRPSPSRSSSTTYRPADKAKATSTARKVMTVRHVSGGTQEIPLESEDQEVEDHQYGSYFTTLACRVVPPAFHVPEVFLSRVSDFAG